MQAICQFCAHFNKLNEDIGECRINPPQLIFHRRFISLHEMTVFPKVGRTHWCGKHKEITKSEHTNKK